MACILATRNKNWVSICGGRHYNAKWKTPKFEVPKFLRLQLLVIFIDSFDDTLQILKENLTENYDYFR